LSDRNTKLLVGKNWNGKRKMADAKRGMRCGKLEVIGAK
jgi:hypothetical protein